MTSVKLINHSSSTADWNKLLMPYEAPELFLISVRVEKGFAVSSDIEPGEGGGELGYDETY